MIDPGVDPAVNGRWSNNERDGEEIEVAGVVGIAGVVGSICAEGCNGVGGNGGGGALSECELAIEP